MKILAYNTEYISFCSYLDKYKMCAKLNANVCVDGI